MKVSFCILLSSNRAGNIRSFLTVACEGAEDVVGVESINSAAAAG